MHWKLLILQSGKVWWATKKRKIIRVRIQNLIKKMLRHKVTNPKSSEFGRFFPYHTFLCLIIWLSTKYFYTTRLIRSNFKYYTNMAFKIFSTIKLSNYGILERLQKIYISQNDSIFGLMRVIVQDTNIKYIKITSNIE